MVPVPPRLSTPSHPASRVTPTGVARLAGHRSGCRTCSATPQHGSLGSRTDRPRMAGADGRDVPMETTRPGEVFDAHRGSVRLSISRGLSRSRGRSSDSDLAQPRGEGRVQRRGGSRLPLVRVIGPTRGGSRSHIPQHPRTRVGRVQPKGQQSSASARRYHR